MPFSLKSMRLGCASQASIAVCTTAATRPFHHRVHSYLADQTKSLAANSAAAYRKSFSFKKRPSVDGAGIHQHASARRHSSAEVGDYTARRKSSSDVKDAIRRSSADVRDAVRRSSADVRDAVRRSSADVMDLLRRNPSGSSGRYLLSDTATFRDDLVLERRDTELLALEAENVSELVKPELHRSTQSSGSGRSGFNQLAIVKSSQPTAPSKDKVVVVLRVSLHCKGCEGKLRKHISKMEGVTSFDIEFETKKVTVIGNVTPLYVLNSITKVKNAQFWPSPTSSTSSSSSSSSASTKSEFSF